MRKAFLVLFAAISMMLVACETGVDRFVPATGSYVPNGGSNRLSFVGGSTGTYETPDGGFSVDTGEVDAGEEEEE